MFQGYRTHKKLQAPFKGINTEAEGDLQYAKYMQNMLSSDNSTCMLRYGTKLVSYLPFDVNRTFRDMIAVMSHLGEAGKSEKIVYQNYLTPLVGIDKVNDIKVEGIVGNASLSRITIDTTPLNNAQKTALAAKIYDGVYFYIRQESLSQGADISRVITDLASNKISFELLLAYDFFDRDYQVDPIEGTNAFELWFERAGLYKLADTGFNTVPLLDDLDPNVIVSHLNYQGKLIIANGIDPVQVYDGVTISPLKGDASVLIEGQITKNARVLTFKVLPFFQAEIERYIAPGDTLALKSSTEEKTASVVSIEFAAPANNLVAVTLTMDADLPDNIRTILYKKPIPPFGFITVANDRLWALAEGLSYKNKFRPASLAMKAYYADLRKSVDGWFNQVTGEIAYIDLANNSEVPDNIEAIIPFQGKVLFLGRETTQVWGGEDPTVNNDGQNIQLPDFQWEMTLPIGILQKSLYVQIPNDFVFLSKYGIVSLSSINEYQQLSVSYNFSNGVNRYLNAQLSFIENDRDYRRLQAFLYPYGRFIGFKVQYNCLIYQLKQNGGWSIFDSNFAYSSSFFYDPVSQDLFLGTSNGTLLAYADKSGFESYEEWGVQQIVWRIQYPWVYSDSTWNNEAVFIALRTLEPINVTVDAYVDYNDSERFTENIEIEQSGSLYDVAQLGNVGYAYREGSFPYELMRFKGDAFMISLSGKAKNQLIFDKLFLTGGAQSGN